jgi:hypothetical protein
MTRARDHACGVDCACVVGGRHQHRSASPEVTTSRCARVVVPSGLKEFVGRVIPRHRTCADCVATATVSWASLGCALRAQAEERPQMTSQVCVAGALRAGRSGRQWKPALRGIAIRGLRCSVPVSGHQERSSSRSSRVIWRISEFSAPTIASARSRFVF